MTFTPGIPNTGQSLGFTKDPIRNNFAVLRSTIATNHIDVNLSGAGKHNLAEFVEQSTSPATSVDECALYAKQAQSVAQLFLQKESQLSGASDVQMSRLDTGVKAAVNGYSFLPGGVIIQWGIGAFVGNASNVNVLFVTSNVNFTAACFNVSLTGIGFNNTFDVTNVTSTGFTASRSLGTFGANQNFYWTAIGN
jgi:hypothetical protein